MQIAGGNGYMQEYPYERLMRDNRINMIFEGTNEIQKTIIGSTALRMINNAIKIGKINPNKRISIKTNLSTHLEKAKTVFEESINLLYKSVKEAYAQKGNHALYSEFMQDRIANISVYLYILIASISKTQFYIDTQTEYSYWLRLLDALTFRIEKEIRVNYKEITDNIDDIISDISDTITQSEFMKRNYSDI